MKSKVKEKMIPESKAKEMLQEYAVHAGLEITRLQAIEEDYKQLLTLVAVIAKQKDLSLVQHVEIKISKQEQAASMSWQDLLENHFKNKNNGIIIGV